MRNRSNQKICLNSLAGQFSDFAVTGKEAAEAMSLVSASAQHILPTPCHASKIPPLTAEDIVCRPQRMPKMRVEAGMVYLDGRLLGEVISQEGNTIKFRHTGGNRYLDGREQEITILES